MSDYFGENFKPNLYLKKKKFKILEENPYTAFLFALYLAKSNEKYEDIFLDKKKNHKEKKNPNNLTPT